MVDAATTAAAADEEEEEETDGSGGEADDEKNTGDGSFVMEEPVHDGQSEEMDEEVSIACVMLVKVWGKKKDGLGGGAGAIVIGAEGGIGDDFGDGGGRAVAVGGGEGGCDLSRRGGHGRSHAICGRLEECALEGRSRADGASNLEQEAEGTRTYWALGRVEVGELVV